MKLLPWATREVKSVDCQTSLSSYFTNHGKERGGTG